MTKFLLPIAINVINKAVDKIHGLKMLSKDPVLLQRKQKKGGWM